MLTQPAISVLSPGDFDRASLEPATPASERLAFDNASSVSSLPFSTIAFAGDTMTYTTTPELLQTIAAVTTPSTAASVTTTSQSTPIATATGNGLFPCVVLALSVAVGVATFLV